MLAIDKLANEKRYQICNFLETNGNKYFWHLDWKLEYEKKCFGPSLKT